MIQPPWYSIKYKIYHNTIFLAHKRNFETKTTEEGEERKWRPEVLPKADAIVNKVKNVSYGLSGGFMLRGCPWGGYLLRG